MIGNKPKHQVDTWNKRIDVGVTVVEYRYHPKAPAKRCVTSSPAYLLGGHTPVVELAGKTGTVGIDCCKRAKDQDSGV